ncbi:MAG: LrgB family protein [Schwartzia sp. (in: firmicutes)]
MSEFWKTSIFFGVFVTIVFYGAGIIIKGKLRWTIFNPLLVAIALTIAFLAIFGIDYGTYLSSAKYIGWLLTPATIALALPLYEQIGMMKRNFAAVLAGVTAGVVTSLTTILALAALFHLRHASYVTLLPKSITTAIGMGVAEELGGYVAITAAVIIVTGILGNMLAEPLCRWAKIENPIARGIAIGAASHAIGTVKAMEMGAVEGAMSSLALIAAGILTVFAAGLYAPLL